MIVRMKTGIEYIISNERGLKLKQLLEAGTDKEFINLDGRGKMVRPGLIERVYSDRPVSEQTEAWKKAIRHNLQVMQKTGKMGRATAEDFLNSAVVTG
jgi:hypothetical protein